MKPTVIMNWLKDTPRRFPGRRPQPWRYLVTDGGNHKVLERSSENLTNRGDALKAIEDVHGPDATVILRQPGQPDRIIRQPAPPPSRRITLSAMELRKVIDGVSERIVGTPFTNPAVLQRVIDIINDVTTQHETHIHTAVPDVDTVVADPGSGQWRCPNCNERVPDAETSAAQMADWSGQCPGCGYQLGLSVRVKR